MIIMIDKYFKDNTFTKKVGLIFIILFVLVSLIYTTVYYKNLERKGNFNLYKDIPYADIKGYEITDTSLDIYTPKTQSLDKLPVMVFIHGGAWTKFFGSKNDRHRFLQKGVFLTNNNFILININYRLSPSVSFPEPVRDASKAVKWVYDNIEDYGGDKNQIYLQGHSAGAQIVSLLVTNEEFLEENYLGLENIKAACLLEGVGYNLLVAKDQELDGKLIDFYYNMPFGDDNALIKASSINYIIPNKNIPPIILFAVEKSLFRIGKTEANEFYKKLIKNNYISEYYVIPDKGHSSLNRDFGTKDDLTTKLTMDFIDRFK